MSTLEYIPLPFESKFSLHVPCNVFASLDLLSKKHLGNSLTMEFVFFAPTTPFVWLFFLFFCCSFVGARTMWSLDSPSRGHLRKLEMVWTCSRINIFFKALANDVDLILYFKFILLKIQLSYKVAKNQLGHVTKSCSI
jgi:hypothetical protein